MLLDQNGNAIQEGTDFALTDGTTSFPIAAGTSTITLTCKPGFCGVRIEAVAADVLVGKGAAGQYKTVYAQSWIIFPITPGNTLTITRPNSTAVEGFWIKRSE